MKGNMTKTFDPKCHELAEYFTYDSERKTTDAEVNDLAATIQTAIEDWMADKDAEDEYRRDEYLESQRDCGEGRGER